MPGYDPQDGYVKLLRSGAIDKMTFARLMNGRVQAFASYLPQNVWTADLAGAPGSGKILLKVAFMNGSRADHLLVAQTAADWTTGALGGKLGDRVEFQFYAKASEAQVRVSFRNGTGNWSKVGSESVTLNIPANKPTMNLDDVETPVIRHEFGHALCLRHEHQNSSRPFHYIPSVVIRDAANWYHWSEATTVQQILDVNPHSSCPVDGGFDYNSVMMYPFPATWTREHIATHANNHISPGDRKCLEWVYGASPRNLGESRVAAND